MYLMYTAARGPVGRPLASRWIALAVLSLTACAGPARVDRSAALDELFQQHADQRVAHILGDADALVASFDDTLLEISEGRVERWSREDARGRFSAYFRAVDFLEWEDVVPPVIRIAGDGSSAWVLVRKRVRTLTRGAGPRRVEAARFAWTERWERGAPGWRLADITSTQRSEEESDPARVGPQAEALEILRAARRALGGEEAVARVALVSFAADCESPQGPFRTKVWSARDGRVRFEQAFPDGTSFVMAVGAKGEWQRDEGGRVDSLGALLRTVVHGHELPLLALAPESRYRRPTAVGRERFDGSEARVVRFLDELEAPVDFLYDSASGRPLAFRIRNHTGRGAAAVVTRFDDWRRVGDVWLPFAASFTQGTDVYRYRMTEVSLKAPPAGTFEGGADR